MSAIHFKTRFQDVLWDEVELEEDGSENGSFINFPKGDDLTEFLNMKIAMRLCDEFNERGWDERIEYTYDPRKVGVFIRKTKIENPVCKSPEKCYCPACIDEVIHQKTVEKFDELKEKVLDHLFEDGKEHPGAIGELLGMLQEGDTRPDQTDGVEDFSEEEQERVYEGVWEMEEDDIDYEFDLFCKKEHQDYIIETVERIVIDFNDRNNETQVNMDWEEQDDYQNDAEIHISFSISKWSVGDSEDESEDEEEKRLVEENKMKMEDTNKTYQENVDKLFVKHNEGKSGDNIATVCNMMTGEFSTDRQRADELLARKPCATPCVPRPMNGRTWWKCVGYNSACACAVKALQKNIGKEDIVGEV